MYIVTGENGYYREVGTPRELCFFFRKKKNGAKLSEKEAMELTSGSVLYVRRKDTRFFYLPVYNREGNLIREEIRDANRIHYEPVLVMVRDESLPKQNADF